MTAEVAVMNRIAVALAADSAATVFTQSGPKIFNANKIFGLSEYQPVGIMIYGNSEFLGIPWETIIKNFRKQLGKNEFPSLEEYGYSFIEYLKGMVQKFPIETRDAVFLYNLRVYFSAIRKLIECNIEEAIRDAATTVSPRDILLIIKNTIDYCHDDSSLYTDLLEITLEDAEKAVEAHRATIEQILAQVFNNITISEEQKKQLFKICVNILHKRKFFGNISSGIVFTGFGEKEFFPTVIWFTIENIVDSKLKYAEEDCVKIEFPKNLSAIVPFAQSEMVSSFMDGIHPYYATVLMDCLNELPNQYPKEITDTIPELNSLPADRKQQILADLSQSLAGAFNTLAETLKEHMRQQHQGPIVDAVAHLPKDELASMAESLVNLTSFKRRVSMDMETVGGPIDVAVISKGDGFIWMKRKFYFQGELNPHFFARFHKKERKPQQGGDSEKLK